MMNKLHVWIPLFCMVCLIGSISSEPIHLQTEHMANPIQIDSNQQQPPTTFHSTIQKDWIISGETEMTVGASVYKIANISSDLDYPTFVIVPIEDYEEQPVVKEDVQIPKDL